jgi:hypothetical protein
MSFNLSYRLCNIKHAHMHKNGHCHILINNDRYKWNCGKRDAVANDVSKGLQCNLRQYT